MATSKEKEPTFEEALKGLESLVESMEEGEIPLDDLVTQFEKGSGLLKICQKRLNAAELRIQSLKNDQKDAQFEPFDGE